MRTLAVLLTCILTIHSTSPPVLHVNKVPKLPENCGSSVEDFSNIACIFDTPQSGTTLSFLRQPQIRKVGLTFFRRSEPGDGSFSNLPNLKALYISGCFKKRFTHKYFEGLNDLRGLNIKSRMPNCSITLTPDWLIPLSSLRTLNLATNDITNILAETFCNATYLKVLDISYNRLTDSEGLGISCVSDGNQQESCRSCLPNVTSLDISHNFISIFNVSLSRDLPKLQHLTITDSNLARITLDNKAVDALVALDLSHNSLSSFTIDNMDKCNGSQLNRLDLANNQIDFITAGFFLCTAHLMYLDISANNLSNSILVEAGIVSLRKLVHLKMNENKIHILQATLIGNMTSLKELHCSRCAIAIIEKDAFLQLTKLEVLRLNSNTISNIDGNIFAHLPNLRSLDLSNNDLITFEVKDGFPSLKLLDLSGNNMQAPPAFRPFSSRVTILDLSRNNITEISSSMQCCPELINLNLAFNKIKNIDTYSFVSQGAMRTLNLSNNVIDRTELNSFFQTTLHRRLGTFLLINDDLPVLLESLMYLDLSRNLIKKVGSIKLFTLKWIDLSWNQISYIDDWKFSGYNPYVRPNHSQVVVNLTYNRLYHLDVASLISLGKPITQVLLEGNLLHCDCHNELITTMDSNM